MTPTAARFLLPLDAIGLDDLDRVGGKNAALGELRRTVGPQGVAVPDGFVVTVDAFRRHLEQEGLESRVRERLAGLDVTDVEALRAAGSEVRAAITRPPLPEDVARELGEAYASLCADAAASELDVAVRSSATAEDLPEASFAGQQDTYLNVRGHTPLAHAVRACMASLFTDRAIVYRTELGISHEDVALSVGVQRMVRSDLACAGVLFTLDTESGFPDVCLVTGAWGLGELVVQGRVDPDEFWVHKPRLEAGFRPIVRRELGSKQRRLVYATEGGRPVREECVPAADRERFVLSDDEVLQLAGWGTLIERAWTERAGRPMPMDIEWAKDGCTGKLFIVQARPETVHSRAGAALELFTVRGGKQRILTTGKSVGARVASGPVRLVRSVADMRDVRAGDVLVAEMTDPDWEPVLARCSAVVTERGGRTCHAAIVSRELGLPCVVGTGDATSVLETGSEVTVSCAEGDLGHVYAGRVPFTREELDPAQLPPSPVPLMINLANPDLAFRVAQLPAAGVGLMRIEFLVNHWIGAHPMALVHPERVEDPAQRAELSRLTAAFASPREFFVQRLAEGVGQIGAAFWPREVIVRFSDFKTNEYATLLGGRAFEPVEANPMIGFRGASRYYDERYAEGFALECEAIARVRREMGLTNVMVMVPFCRTLEEGRRVLAAMAAAGLPRGVDGLLTYVMCEIPNNVVLAEQFADLFDGFSIGSNDLTQLTLGVDRDSELLAHLFDERDPGVKWMIEHVVRAAHAKGSKVGICGQAPSDYPEFAAWLAEIGIDSMSLNPDSIARVARKLAAAR
ncbi:MAG: phosphoenolpyruvate synthase [bacterium]|nr:phosphoenolpyruvate synthase [bacterium]